MRSLEEANKRIEQLEEGIKTLLQEPKLRDQKGMDFFFSDGNVFPNGELTSFLYGAKKYHDYLKIKIDKLLSLEPTKKP